MSDLTLRFFRLISTAAFGLVPLALGGCIFAGQLDESGGVIQVRSSCPAVAVAAGTGDITLFNPPQSTDAAAIDVVAEITNVRPTCDDSAAQIYTEATFDIYARRTNSSGARTVTLPYYSVVVRGGTAVISKRVGQATLSFAAGADRAQASVKAASYVDKSAATLPDDIKARITKRREPGELDAATDPLNEPDVKAALQRTSFEQLIGFNLTADQLKYNLTR
jgi:hypothetical protein